MTKMKDKLKNNIYTKPRQKIKIDLKLRVARLTVECHKLVNRVYQRANLEPSSTTLAPSSLFGVGKILIYGNTDYHKLHQFGKQDS